MPRLNGDLEEKSVRRPHGLGRSYYSQFPDGRPHPVVWCLCGEGPKEEIFNSWESAGKWLDGHIREALRLEDLKYHASLKASGENGAAVAPARAAGSGR